MSSILAYHEIQLRVTLSYHGIVNVSSTRTPAVTPVSLFPKSLSLIIAHTKPTFRIFISPLTTKGSVFTSHKTTKREVYDRIRSLIPVKSSGEHDEHMFAEVLLVNNEGDIMEGSITTPFLSRDQSWITPKATCLGNLGTTRRYALEQGLCKEGIVRREEIQLREPVVLSNGVRGFGWGFVEALEPAHK